MKKLYLLFGFALMGVLFFACQKDEPIVEKFQGIELESTERTPWADPYIFDFTDCIDDGGCPCRLINLNASGTEIDMCTEWGHYHYNPNWTYGLGLNLHGPLIPPSAPPGSGSYFNRSTTPGNPICTIPMNDCDPSYAGGVGMLHELFSPFSWSPGSQDAQHYYFAYEGVIPFCFLPDGFIKICNPHTWVTEWHLVCGLDVYPNQWETFFILPGECLIFRVNSNCDVEECEVI